MLRYIVISLCVMVSACSSEFAYNHLDWLAKWYLDDFVSLNDRQEDEFDQRLNAFIAWHKEDELAFYQSHLKELKQKVAQEALDEAAWEKELIRFRSHWVMLRNQAGLHLVEMAPQLSKDQVSELFENLSEQNQERKSDIEELTLEERKEAQFEQLLEAVETRIGTVSKAQIKLVDEFVESYDSTSLLHNRFSASLIQMGRECFELNEASKLSACLMPVLIEPEQFRTEEYQSKVQRNRQRLASMMTKLNASLNSDQHAFFQNYLQEQIDFIADLQGSD